MKAIVAAAVLAALYAVPAYSQTQPPTDVDLRAAYCLEATKLARADLRTADEEHVHGLYEILTRLADRQNRLTAYVGLRLIYLNPTGLIVATRRADADVQQLRQNAALAEPLQRVSVCNDLSWLPF